MTLFNGFYPTPKPLAEKMLEGINWNYVGSVLEPSGGKGDLADIVKEKMIRAHTGRWNNSYTPDIDVIEINPDLQSIIKGKGYRLIHNDFLNFNTYKKYDLIVMNPQFDNGDKHLLKAIELQKDGGSIICLLNSETLKNPYSYSRQELVKKLNELNADIVYLSEEFKNADRKTNVEVALIKIHIPNKERDSIILDNLDKAERLKEATYEQTQITENDFIKATVAQFNYEVQAGLKLIKEYKSIKPIIQNRLNDQYSSSVLTLSLYGDRHPNGDIDPNEYIQLIRKKYWEALFLHPKFTSCFPSNLLEKCRGDIEILKDYDFSEWNIKAIRAELTIDLLQATENTIEKLFETMTAEHFWHKEMQNNRHYFQGWATNSAYKINKKVILPIRLYQGLGLDKDDWGHPYKTFEEITDIDKTLRHLSGNLTEGISATEVLDQAKKDGQSKDLIFEYFTLNCFKKGTVHIYFTDEELLKRFNIYGCKRRNWLPPGYGKKEYNEMNQEEKEVINSFEGEEEYNKVIQNPEIYLPEIKGLLQLGE